MLFSDPSLFDVAGKLRADLIGQGSAADKVIHVLPAVTDISAELRLVVVGQVESLCKKSSIGAFLRHMENVYR